mgnify:CR=1 FL=1
MAVRFRDAGRGSNANHETVTLNGNKLIVVRPKREYNGSTMGRQMDNNDSKRPKKRRLDFFWHGFRCVRKRVCHGGSVDGMSHLGHTFVGTRHRSMPSMWQGAKFGETLCTSTACMALSKLYYHNTSPTTLEESIVASTPYVPRSKGTASICIEQTTPDHPEQQAL